MKWDAPQEHKEAAAGALLILGGMLYEWGLPLDRAIEGLKRAYAIEAAKHIPPVEESDFLTKHPSERKGCLG